MESTKNISEIILDLGDQILNNQIEECGWNDKMLEAQDEQDFRKLIVKRSAAIRSFFTDNEKIIHQLEQYLCSLTDESANAFCDVARKMYLHGAIDKGLIVKIADPVIAYYKAKRIEVEKTIILSLVRSSCVFDYYYRMDYQYKFEESIENLKWVISFKDRYCEFDDVRVRGNILMAYTNLLSYYISLEDDFDYIDVLKLLKEADELWSDERVQKLDGENPFISFVGTNLYFYLPFQFGMYAINRKQSAKEIFEICQDYCDRCLNNDLWNEKVMKNLVRIAVGVNDGEIKNMDAIEEILQMIENLPETDWENTPEQSQMIFQSFGVCYLSVRHLLGLADLSVTERERIVNHLQSILDRIVYKLPYNYNNSYVSDVLKSIFAGFIECVDSSEIIDEMANNLLIQRQFSTYFHSVMVEEISALVVNEIIEKEPELFCNLPDYKTIQDVLNKKDTLIQSIRRVARMHDLGKCNIPSVIMLQSRRLFDDEFMCIKGHPQNGVKYIAKLKGYDLYKDVILGHHKTYDGKGGYPDNFDNTSSPYRFVIDLVSICDSIDAATDITGRNYATGKDFSVVMSELKAEAGSRYNPDIVRIISESTELMEKLSNLTKEERLTYLYKVYHR